MKISVKCKESTSTFDLYRASVSFHVAFQNTRHTEDLGNTRYSGVKTLKREGRVLVLLQSLSDYAASRN